MENKVSLQDLANGIAAKKGITKKDAEVFVRTLFDIIRDSLRNDKIVKVKGFGTFKLVMMESRESINVNNGERILIKGYTKVSFTPDPTLRDIINKPFAQFETVLLYDGTKTEDMERIDNVVPEAVEETEEQSEAVVHEAHEVAAELENGCIEESAEPVVENKIDKQEESVQVDIPTNVEVIEPIVEDDVNKEPEAVAEEVVVENKIETVASNNEPEEKKKKKNNRWMWLILIFLLLIGFGYYYVRNYTTLLNNCCAEDIEVVAEPQQEVVSEEVVLETVDSVKTEEAIEVVDTVAYPQVANGEFVIVGTKLEHVLKSGETLRTVSLKYYGTKEYSEYIVVYNGIEAPDLVPVGMLLKIPELRTK